MTKPKIYPIRFELRITEEQYKLVKRCASLESVTVSQFLRNRIEESGINNKLQEVWDNSEDKLPNKIYTPVYSGGFNSKKRKSK